MQAHVFPKTSTTKFIGSLLPVPLEVLRLFMVQDFSKNYERTSRITDKNLCFLFYWLILLCGFLLYFLELQMVYIYMTMMA